MVVTGVVIELLSSLSSVQNGRFEEVGSGEQTVPEECINTMMLDINEVSQVSTIYKIKSFVIRAKTSSTVWHTC